MPGMSDFPQALMKDAYKWYWEAYDKLETVHDKIFKEWPTDGAFEKITSAVGSGMLEEKGEWDDIALKHPIEGFIAYGRVRDFSKMEAVSKDLRDDVQKVANFLKSQIPIWTQDEVETKEQFFANVFNYGGYTAGHTMFNASIPNILDDQSGDYIYDSKPLFNASNNLRSSKGGGTYYNGLGALNFSLPNLQTMWNRMTVYNNRREDDQPMKLVPDTILLHPAMKFIVEPILDSPDDPTTSNRAKNSVYGLVKPLYWSYLTDTDQWTLMKKLFGLWRLVRQNPEFDMWEDKKSKVEYMSIFNRWGVLINNWRGVSSANYATS